MIAHYLAVTLATFRQSPFTTVANALTLALGLACFIAAYGIAEYWRSADTYHANADRIIVIGEGVTLHNNGGLNDPGATSSPTISKYLRTDFPELAPIARAFAVRDVPVVAGDNKLLVNTAYVDPEFLELFTLDFLAGDPHRALAEPGAVVLTQDLAVRLFGNKPAIGQRVRVDNAWDGTVTGEIAPVRQPSFMGTEPDSVLRFEMLTHWPEAPAGPSARDNWLSMSCFTFATLPAASAPDVLNSRLAAFVERRAPPEQRKAADIVVLTFPLHQLTTRRLDNLLTSRTGIQLSTAAALVSLGVLTLIIACVNYANLATAQAAGRMKEVGIRKVLGAGRLQIVMQSLIEALVLTAAAFALALAVLAAAAPAIRSSTGIDMLHFVCADGALLGTIAGLVLLVVSVACIASVYPIVYLCRVHPIAALQSGQARTAPRFVAQTLVGIQFASASFLLILVIVTQLERAHLERTALAPRQDPIVILNNIARYGVDYETLAGRLQQIPTVKGISVVDKTLWGFGSFNILQFSRSRAAGASAPSGYFKPVGYDYFATLNLPILAGRVFDRKLDTRPVDLFSTNSPDTPPIVIDRLYAARLGFQTPAVAVGQIIYVPASFTEAFGHAAQPARVIGVTESEPSRVDDVGEDIAGTIYTYTPKAPWGSQYPVVRIARDDVRGSIAAITQVWNELAPEVPPDFHFFDELFELSYRQYSRMTALAMLLALSAFVIACVGQLGIAVHIAARHRREVAIRKTLGSTVMGAVRKLLVDFSKPVLIANLVAWPLAYVAANAYLQQFADRIQLTATPFVLSLAITLVIGCAAVIGEVLKSASVRPAEVLRHT